ncbi:MAG: DUF502 domain-containing protein [Planctomycetes bacterium]|nr:DUF502 domain-containing protein [Planctomycetota bacterium]
MKKLFAKGFAALLPMFLTIFVLYFIISTLYNAVGKPMGEVIRWAADAIFTPNHEEPFWKWFFTEAVSTVIGAVIGCVLVFLIGSVVATFFGKKLYEFFERLLSKLPVIRVVYPYAKQFTEFFFKGEQKMEFKAVVAIPFPTEGIYSIGFPTSEGLRHLNEATKKKMVCVFVPTSPTPFTGFTVYVPREQVIILPISVEEAMRIIISCGVVAPLHQSASLTEAPSMPVTHEPVPAPLERHLGPKP